MDIELIREIFTDAGIEADDDAMSYVFDQFETDAINSADLYSMTHDYSPKCSKCERLESELKEVMQERDAYVRSVKERRGASRVWVDKYGHVKYEL